MGNRIVLITGATSGIGKETARALVEKGFQVILVSRNEAKLKKTSVELEKSSKNTSIDTILCDLSSQESIRQLSDTIHTKYDRIDVLINNAGLIIAPRRTTVDGLEYTFALNHLGYFLLTGLLLDLLKAGKSARIVNVSSRAHQRGHIYFEDLMLEKNYTAMKAYSQSKLANVLFTYELAGRLEGTGITVNCLHPGVVRSNFGMELPGLMKTAMLIARPFFLNPSQGAQTSIYLASSSGVADITGKYFVKKQEVSSSPESYDEEIARRLWEVSEKLTHFKYPDSNV
ncbi:MAG: SDR family oxidoreductase [Calditrichota bacterium]|jgi:retinol dehydrogenase-14